MRACSIVAFLLALAVPGTAQTSVVHQKLSGPVVTGTIGDVADPVISSDGTAVLYRLIRNSDVTSINGLAQLVVAPTDGGSDPLPLSPGM